MKRTALKRPVPLPPEVRCKRTRCIRRAVYEGLCLAHAKKKPLLNSRGNTGSGPEKKRRPELQILLQAGVITNLREQVAYPCRHNGVLLLTWHSDFTYEENGREIAEDTKAGLISDQHRRAMRHMKAFYPEVEVRELDMRDGKKKPVRRIR